MGNTHRLAWLVVLAIALLVLPSTAVLGWNGTGHKVVALIAWEDLTPKAKAAVTEILKQHPRYEKDLLLGAPVDQTPDEQARTAFATAATWSDMVRNPANPMSASHNHPAWHYIDIPYCTDGQKTGIPPNDAPGPHNCVEALTQCVAELKDPAKSAADKAADICWVEHLIGDIHQPLHAVSWYSPAFPTGDQGGNAEMVLKNPPYPDSAVKLHALWDGLAGDFQSEIFSRFEAAGLRADPDFSRDKMKQMLTVTDFMDWAKDSHELAIKDVYLDGTLQTAPARGRHDAPSTRPTPGAPPGYVAKAEHVALHRICLAGYRLADQLNAIYDPK